MQDNKLENTVNSLAEEEITFCYLQEMWLSRNDLFQIEVAKDSCPAMRIMFHHQQPKQTDPVELES
eukprot:15334321-Ditylum_brightwellii.AAC.1